MLSNYHAFKVRLRYLLDKSLCSYVTLQISANRFLPLDLLPNTQLTAFWAVPMGRRLLRHVPGSQPPAPQLHPAAYGLEEQITMSDCWHGILIRSTPTGSPLSPQLSYCKTLDIARTPLASGTLALSSARYVPSCCGQKSPSRSFKILFSILTLDHSHLQRLRHFLRLLHSLPSQ